jgi:hypothetical protein
MKKKERQKKKKIAKRRSRDDQRKAGSSSRASRENHSSKTPELAATAQLRMGRGIGFAGGVPRHIPTRYRFWKLKPFSLSQACFASITSS